MRLFLAINLGDAVRERVFRDAASLREAVPTAAWVRSESLHVTLKFLGEVDEATLPTLSSAVGRAALHHQVFPLEFRGIGAFPNLHRPRVVWLGAPHGEAAVRLARDIAGACEALGFPPEERRFTAHVTLGRVRKPLAPAELRALEGAARRLESAYRVTVTSVEVMRSDLSPQRSRYSVMASLPLRAA